MSSLFQEYSPAPPDAVFGIAMRCRADPYINKVDLSIGAYRNEQCEPYVFKVVRKAEDLLYAKQLSKEYLPLDGLATLKKPTQKLVFGETCKYIANDCIATVQSLSGTGALRLAADLIVHLLPQYDTIYMSMPTWPNHQNIIHAAGLDIKNYTYWDKNSKSVDFEGMKRDISSISQPSVILLHACGHNPTGMDLTIQQWQEVIDLLKHGKHFPLFDLAYQGFVSGNLDEDAAPIRMCADTDLEFMVCQSFAKNMGLYGERIGMLHVVCKTSQVAQVVVTHLKQIIRSLFSSPPNWGSRIVELILNDVELKNEWKVELTKVAQRLIDSRKLLYDGLMKKSTPGSWDHLAAQRGMFSYTGLNEKQCNYIIDRKHVYLLPSGRISLAGLNHSNNDRVVDAIDEAVRLFPS